MNNASNLKIDEKYLEGGDFPVDDELLKVLSLETANSRQLLQAKVKRTLHRFQLHRSDTGSPSVQSKLHVFIFKYLL